MDYAHSKSKVYPLDVDASMEYQPKYVVLNNNNSTHIRPPPQRRNIPRYHSGSHGGSCGDNCCIRCVCCCFCFWFVLILVLSGLAFVLYSVLQPRPPLYKVDKFEVNAFNMQPDFSLYTEFTVTVKAQNPNTNIGFVYGKSSSVVVAYEGSSLCNGKLPAFHQPTSNTTMINIVLTGKSEFGSGLQGALMDNRETGKVPLLVMVKAPVSVVIHDIPLREFVVYVNCSMVVDNLAPNKKIGILSADYEYGVGL